MWPLPQDVREWLTGVFRSCDERTSAKLTKIPTLHETSLDHTFIEQLSQFSAPFCFPSEWFVRIDTHYLGGGRHFGEWEIADIGVLVTFRRAGRLIRSKVALLQSKRLYSEEQDFEEDHALDYLIGFGRLYEPDDKWAAVIQPRPFSFTATSRYRALLVRERQYTQIAHYEHEHRIPVYYLLYHPWRIPSVQELPIHGNGEPDGTCEVGCRVVPAAHLRATMKSKPKGYAPAYGDLVAGLASPFTSEQHRAGWRMDHFVVELLLQCRTGYVASTGPELDAGLFQVFSRRTGPIAAAIAITIDAPASAPDLLVE